VPIGNWEGSKLTFLTDIIYSRLLADANMISWYSETPTPDLGGYVHKNFNTILEEEYSVTKVINPVFCKNYAVEVKISNFVINALLVSDELMKMDKEVCLMTENLDRLEHAGGADADDGEELPTDAFQLINKMIFEWFKAVYLEEDEICDTLATYLHKWSVDEGSRLFDPSLKKLLQKIIKKVFNH
jgi:DNA polymerase epsilon subunit 1